MRFEVLGSLRVRSPTGRSVQIPEFKVRALLAALLVQDGAPVSVDRLAQDLWGDRQPAKPAAALQRKIWQLRRALEEAEPGARALIDFGSAGYALRARDHANGSASPDSTDSGEFAALTARARRTEDPVERARLLSEALALWRGPALADFRDEDFAASAITRLEEQRLVALEEHAEARLALGEHGQLAGELAELVAAHPLRERLRASQLRVLYRSGRATEALDSYQELRARLAGELGMDPGPELAAVHQAILEQDPELAGPVPAPPRQQPRAPSRSVPTNLPTPLTPLIGRAPAIAEVTVRLAERRLVTLTGPGGVGKTRLAVGVAAELVDQYADGVWLVELAGQDGSAVAAVAGVLGLRDDTGLGLPAPTEPASPVHSLAASLREKSLLLVLDNCEQLIEQVAELAGPLLSAVPGLRVLATSREPLGLAGESLWDVPPLDIPEASADRSELEQSSAVRLFVARAADAAGAFELTSENAADVATLCRRLDGIPLALELAATRVRTLGVAGLVERLDDRFRLLAAGFRGAPHRQQTLRAMIDWSWDLLTEAERVVLRRLAVQVDGCTLEAAEAVCADAEVTRPDVLDLLTRLVSRSLVVADGTRFRLLETVASYGQERLREAVEYETVRRRHLDYYLDLAVRADSGLRGRDQVRWLRRLDAESANLRAALDGALRLGEPEPALRLVNTLGWYWILRGRLREGRRWLTTALSGGGGRAARATATVWEAGMAALLGECDDPVTEVLDSLDAIDDIAARARAEWFLVLARLGSGDVTINENVLGRALGGFEAAADHWGLAAALSARATLAVARGELGAAAADAERSLALFRELGDRWGQLQATEVLGVLAEIAGDYSAAARHRRDGLGIAEEFGLWSDAANELSGLGRLALLTGDFAAAERFHQRARRLAIDRSSKADQHVAEVGLALGARQQGDFAGAERFLLPWLAWCDDVGWLPGKALVLAELGFTAEQRGDAEIALTRHLDGLRVARAISDPRAVALALEGVAGADARLGRQVRATRLLGVATAARAGAGAPLPAAERGDVDRIERTLRAGLGDDVFETEFASGRGWDRADCVRELIGPAS